LLKRDAYHIYSAAYDSIYNTLRDLYEKNVEQQKNLKDDSLNHILENQLNVISTWPSIVKQHKKYFEKTIKEYSDEVEKNIDSIKDNEEDKGREPGFVEKDTAPKEVADPEVIALINALPEVDKKNAISGRPALITSPNFGLPQSGSAKRNWDTIIDALSGITSYDGMVTAIKELANGKHPQFHYLLDWIPKSEENMTEEDMSLTRAFVQTLSLPSVMPMGLQIKKSQDEKGKTKFEVSLFEMADTSWYKVKNLLDDDFENDSNRNFRLEDETFQAYIDAQAVVDKYLTDITNPKTQNQTTLKFLLDVFGLDFVSMDKQENRHVLALANEVGKKMFGRLYIHKVMLDNEGKNPSSKPGMNTFFANQAIRVRRPLGAFSRTFDEDQLKVLNEVLTADPNYPFKKKGAEGKMIAEPIDNFKHPFQNLLSKYDKIYQLAGGHSFLNIENKLEYRVKPWNELLYSINALSKAEHIDDLANNLQTSHIVNSTFAKYSRWLGKLFDEEGKKKKRPLDEKQLQDITVLNWNGAAIQDTYDTKAGKKTTNMIAEDKFVTDFLAFLKTGTFENLRFGAKDSAFAVTFKGSQSSDEEVLSFNRDKYVVDETLVLPADMITQYQKYVLYEIEMAIKHGDEQLFVFNKLLTQKTKDKLFANYRSVEDKSTFRKVKNIVFKDTDFKKELEEYFITKAIKNQRTLLGRALLKDVTGTATHAIPETIAKDLGELRGIENYTVEAMEQDIIYFFSNYFTHQIELVHLLISSPRNYQLKTTKTGELNLKEMFKRLGAVSSPGRQAHMSQAYVNAFNKHNKKELTLASQLADKEFVPETDVTSWNDRIRMSLSEDISVHNAKGEQEVLKYYELSINEEYRTKGKTISAAKLKSEAKRRYTAYTKKSKEGDGQAWGNLDFFKFYMSAINRWSPAHESMYQAQVAFWQAVKAYEAADQTDKIKLLNKVLELKEVAARAALPSLKLGLYGSALGHPDSKTLGKFSVHILLPSVVWGTDLETQMDNMLKLGSDLHTFQSGSKMQFPAKTHRFYDMSKEKATVNPLTEENIATFSIEALREQQYIAPKFKNKATLSTQFVKLIFTDFFDNGTIAKGLPKEASALIEDLRNKFIDATDKIIAVEKIQLAKAMGIELDRKTLEIKNVDKSKFYEWLKNKADQQEASTDLLEFAEQQSQTSKPYSLETIQYRRFIDTMLTSELNRKLIKPDITGEAYIQTASTGYVKKNQRYTNPTTEQLTQYGINGLRGYRVEDGELQPAEIKLTFTHKKHGALLNLNFKGSKIGTVERLNLAIKDSEWLAEHKDKITIAGVRIPVQGINSMEYLRIKEFLPTSAGPIIIVPPEIVIKSGSDFDIDKLFMYEPSFDRNGNILNVNYDTEALMDYETRTVKLSTSKEALVDALDNLLDIFNTLDVRTIKSSVEKAREEIEKMKEEIDELPDATGTVAAPSKKAKKTINSLQDLAFEFRDTGDVTKLEKVVQDYHELMADIDEHKASKPSNVLKTQHNKLLATTKALFSNPMMFEALTTTLDTTIVKSAVEDFTSKERMDIEFETPVTSTDAFSPQASVQVHRDAIGGKAPLGINAKMNALHRLYQQAGLRFVSTFLNTYHLESNKADGQLILGGKYTVDGDLISAIQSELISASVDIEKEDWIMRILADKVRTPFIQQMLIQGTPLKTIIAFTLQPVVSEYLRNSSSTLYRDILHGKPKRHEEYLNMLKKGLIKADPDLFKEIHNAFKESESEDEQAFFSEALLSNEKYINLLTSFSYDESFKSYKPSVAGGAENGYTKILNAEPSDDLRRQLAVLAQFYIISRQNDALLDLNNNIDFNTSKFSSIQEMYNNYTYLNELPVEVFNVEALEYLRDSAVTSPFNAAKFGIDLMKPLYTITSDERFMAQLKVIADGKFLRNKQAWMLAFGEDFITSVVQNYGEISTAEGVEYYPLALYDRKNEYSLPNRYKDLIERAPDNPDIQRFMNTRAMQQLRFRDADPNSESTNAYPVFIGITDKSTSKDRLMYEIKDLFENFVAEDPELNQELYNFMEHLTTGTIVNMGFKIKLNTIQPFISYKAYSHLIEDAIANFKDSIMKNDDLFNAYISAFTNIFDPEKKRKSDSPLDDDLTQGDVSAPNTLTAREAQYFKNYRELQNDPEFVAVKNRIDTYVPAPTRGRASANNLIKEGDIWTSGGIPIITTNLGGVHGAGLANQAFKKGYIKYKEEGEFGDRGEVITFPVKKVWSDKTNMTLLKDSADKLVALANANPNKMYSLPLIGLGHGEGTLDEIVPIIKSILDNTNNVQLVLPTKDIDRGKQGTARTDNSLTMVDEIKKRLSNLPTQPLKARDGESKCDQ
jgi:hypothetical protein